MKISIVTTNYNTGDYLQRTIESVLSQEGAFDLEYIITDGGSTDGSLNIIKRYEDRIRYISEKDGGQSCGINKGLKMATGDIVAFLNADDVYTEGALEKVSRYFKENPECKWLTGYCKIIDEEEREVRKFITRYKNYKLRRYSPESLLIENYISQPATFWRRELIEELGYMDETLHFTMDADYWCRIGQKYDLYLIKEYLAKFRITPDTKTGSSVEKTLDESISLTRRYTENKMLLFRKKLSNLRRLIVYKHILGRFRDRGVTN